VAEARLTSLASSLGAQVDVKTVNPS